MGTYKFSTHSHISVSGRVAFLSTIIILLGFPAKSFADFCKWSTGIFHLGTEYSFISIEVILCIRADLSQRVASGKNNIEAIKERADIVNIIKGYGITLKKTGHNFKGLCPFHNEKAPSFTVYPEQNRFHCYGCLADGDVFAFIMKIENIDFATAAMKAGTL